MLVLCNMAEYLTDFDDVEDDFEYDGRFYCFEPEYTDEELLERRMQKQREEQLAREQQTAARPRIDVMVVFLWTMFTYAFFLCLGGKKSSGAKWALQIRWSTRFNALTLVFRSIFSATSQSFSKSRSRKGSLWKLNFVVWTIWKYANTNHVTSSS